MALHKFLEACHAVTAIALDVIESFVSPVNGGTRTVVQAQCTESNADRDFSYLPERVLFDLFAETLEGGMGKMRRGRLEEGNELFATEAEKLIVESECAAHHLCQTDQHFVTDEVAVSVVDLLEMVDIANGNPVASAGRAAAP